MIIIKTKHQETRTWLTTVNQTMVDNFTTV